MRSVYRHIIILLCLFWTTPSVLLAQDPNFSQFYNNPVYYNPGMAAIGKGYTFRANARNHWGPIPGRFNTFSGAFEGELLNKLGVGVMGFSDVAGEGLLRTTGGYLTYSYRPVETKNFLMQFGVTAGLLNKSIDWSRLTFSDQYDEVYGQVNPTQFIAPNTNSVLYPDFSSGMAIRFNNASKSSRNYKKFMATFGFSMNHLNQPKDAFMSERYLPLKYVLHGNVSVLFGQNILSPGFIFERQNEFQTFTLGTYLVNKPISVGFWFRNRTYMLSGNSFDSFIFSAGTHLPLSGDRNLRITYSIDFTISKLRTSSFGSHELSLVYDLDDRYLLKNFHAKKRKKRSYQCPDDFNGWD